MIRTNRLPLQMRNISFEVNYTQYAHGSCLVKQGNTWVLCTAMIEDRVPQFLQKKGQGWITAEYNMLPSSTKDRIIRDSIKNKQNGRTFEIQRLIARSLRAAINLEALGERTITIDCDVLQADGGTRTAAINGGYVALQIALRTLQNKGLIIHLPIIQHISAISCGLVNEEILIDLDYNEDSNASIDANFVYTSTSKLVEVQCTGEKTTFDHHTILNMLNITKDVCMNIIEEQKKAIAIALQLKT